MKIFIVEDDIYIIKILEQIIEFRELGNFLGHAVDGLEGEKQIKLLKPDIVLIDLLMPGKDGISLIKEIKEVLPKTQFIMISQVTSKDIIEKAYKSGVEFYISKPINAVEVENVIRRVSESLSVNQTLSEIERLFSGNKSSPNAFQDKGGFYPVKNVLQRIGILGEAGSQDIIQIVQYMLHTNTNLNDYTIKDICSCFTENPKSMEQRIRRTAFTGMVNLANLGIEDYMNEIFVEYSNTLYNFEQVKKEMDFIRKKTRERGKVNLKKFLDGLLFYCEK